MSDKPKDNNGETDDLDDFWDIDSITPRKKQVSEPHTPPKPAEISFGTDAPAEPSAAIPPKSRNDKARQVLAETENRLKLSTVELEYEPDDSLIKSVRICKWPTSYTFYERFLSDALKYYRVKCDESPYVPFFSYMPQYNQMNIDQLRYYIWWRRNLRHGHYLKTDLSYIFLYFYEIINLNIVSDPAKRLNAMCDVWLAYRQTFPKIDRYIGEWVCDFCLIHMLPPPLEKLDAIMEDVVSVVTLREFYLPKSSRAHDLTLLNFVKRNNTYKYENSSVCTEKTKEIFDKHIFAAVIYAIEKTQHIKDGETTLSHTRISRASYNGALCVCEAKRRIDIDYLSMNHTYRFKGLITSFVKCAENGIRAALGVKSRLSTPGLSNDGIEAINEYFAANLPPLSRIATKSKPKTEEEIRYEFYDVPAEKEGFSHEGALSIEEKSWELTDALVEEDDKELPAEAEVCDTPAEQTTAQSEDDVYSALCHTLSASQLRFLTLLATGDKAAAEQSARENGMLPDAVSDAINSLSSDLTGDIIIEDLQIIPDYSDELIAALKAM